MTRRDTTGVALTALCVSLSLTIAILGGVSVAVAPATAANGSVDGGTITQCGTIDQPGSYELGGDITAPDTDACLTVSADDVTIDGAGHTVDGVDNDTLSYGVRVTGADVTVTDLTVSGFAQGVRVEGDGFLSRELTATENGVYGVSIFGTNGVALNDSTVARNGETGVYTSSAGDTVVARTVVRNHPRFGIYVGGDTGGTVVEDGHVVDAGEAGIYVSGGSGPRIDGTTVEATGDDPNIEAGNGAGVYASAPGTVLEGVTITGSAGHGVHLVGSAEDTGFAVRGATVTDNAGDGVRVDGTLRASVSTLTARENRDGLNLTDAVRPTVSGAVVESNARHGVSVDGGSGASLNAVEAVDNGAWAVFLSDDPSDVTATGVVLDSATLAFTASDVAVGPGPVPGGDRPAGERTVGAFFNATTTAETESGTGGLLGGGSGDGDVAGYLDVDVSYTDAGLGDVNESTLAVSRYDGGNWSTASSTVDTDSNTVSANLTDPAAGVDGGDVFGPLGELEGAVVECTTIDSPGAYVLDTDLSGVSGPCITIASSDVTLDGSGHHVSGDETGSGVLVDGSGTLRNVTVSDLQVSGFARGASLFGTDGVTVENVNASDNVYVGVGANDSSALTLDGVTASTNGREASGGDPLFGTGETEAVDGVGVLLDGVDGATMTGTTMADNRGEDVVLTGGTVADLGPTDVDGTTMTLTDARDVAVSPVESPQSPESGYEAVTGYVNISATSDRASATVTLGYDEGAVGDESALVLGKYDESWSYFGGVDTSANTVTAEISSFSQFAVLESQDGGSGSGTPTPTPTPTATTTPTPTPTPTPTSTPAGTPTPTPTETETPTPTPTPTDGGNGGSGTTDGGGGGTAPSGGGGGDGGSTASADIVVVDGTLNRTEVEAGETVGVTAVVENRGDARDESEVELYIGERFVESRFVTLDPGERRNVTFERSFDEPGTYEIRTGEVLAGNLTVTEATAGGRSGSDTGPPTPSPNPGETATSTPSDGTGDGSSDGSTAAPTTPTATPESTERPAGTAVEPGAATPMGTVAPATSDRPSDGTPLAPAGVGDGPVTAIGMAGAAIAIGGGAYLVLKN